MFFCVCVTKKALWLWPFIYSFIKCLSSRGLICEWHFSAKPFQENLYYRNKQSLVGILFNIHHLLDEIKRKNKYFMKVCYTYAFLITVFSCLHKKKENKIKTNCIKGTYTSSSMTHWKNMCLLESAYYLFKINLKKKKKKKRNKNLFSYKLVVL